MKKCLLFFCLVFALLACQQTPVPEEPIPTITQNLGILELPIRDSGLRAGQITRVRVSSKFSSRSTFQRTNVALIALANIPTQNDGAFDYLQAQFKVQNTGSTAFQNLTLYAVAKAGNIGGTAIKSITNFGGIVQSEQTRISKLVTPTHGLNVSSTGATLIAGREDLQFFTPNEVSALQTSPAWTANGFSSNDKLLGYGFVVRRCTANCDTAAPTLTRSIPADSDGLVTIALKIPRSSGTAYDFVLTFAVLDEAVTRVSRSVYPPESLSSAEARLAGFSADSGAEIMQQGLARAANQSSRFVNQGTDAVAVSSSNDDYTALGLGRLSSGFDHSCALTATGAAYCWGGNGSGQLGNNTTTSSNVPVPVSGNLLFSSISAGSSLTCAVTVAGTAYCWGDNRSGGLGNNTTINSSIPVAVSGDLVFSSIGVSDDYSACGLTTTGAAYCWGQNQFRQLGNNSTTNSPVPVVVSGNLVFSSLSVGGAHSCALTFLAQAYCWGYNAYGQLGIGTLGTNIGIPTLVNGTFSSIVAGAYHTCALTANGTASCWGLGNFGQLGAGNVTQIATPIAVSTTLKFSSLDGGERQTCGLTPSSTLYCWGRNTNGELGTGTTANADIPALVGGGLTFASFSTGGQHTCAMTTTGLSYCWGRNTTGQIGNNKPSRALVPTVVGGNLSFSSIYANDYHTCALTPSGQAYCWGANTYGQLGNNSTTDSDVPVAVSTNLRFSSLTSNGFGHTCGLAKDTGLAYCWGYNVVGQLGSGNTIGSLVPVAVAAPTGGNALAFSSLASGNGFVCGISSATVATVYCWGSNSYGQLGGAAGNRSSPTAVSTTTGLSGVTTISAGNSYVCAITNAQNLYCWGRNDDGQLGNGTTTSRNVPALVGLSFTSVSAGFRHTCGVRSDATLCWGDNSFGQLGTGDNTSSLTAKVVAGGLTFSSVVLGEDHSCGIQTNGTTYCWGNNSYGAVGNNSQTNSNVPVLVSGGLSFSSLTASFQNTCGFTTSSTAYCWGNGGYGQLAFQAMFLTPARDSTLGFKL